MIIKNLVVSLTLILTIISAVSQDVRTMAITPVCLQNGDFASWNGQTIEDPCIQTPTFNAGAIVNWTRSHGTPRIGQKTTNPQYRYIYMFDNYYGSEGIFATYNFVPGQHYRIDVEMQYNGTVDCHVKLWAANGLTQGLMNDCQYPLPTNINNKELITDFTKPSGPYFPPQQTLFVDGNAGVLKTYTFYDYTPNSNYSQFWIHPQLTVPPSSTSKTVEVCIKKITICSFDECTNLIVFDDGLLPSGTTTAGSILIDRRQFAAPVFPDGINATNLVARQQITIKPGFLSPMAIGGSFSASILPCSESIVSSKEIGNSKELRAQSTSRSIGYETPLEGTNPDSLYAQRSKYSDSQLREVQVIPTIGDHNFDMTYDPKLNPNMFEILDVHGRTVVRKKISANNGRLVFNSSILTKGIYFFVLYHNSALLNKPIRIIKM
jgi:hypothetical protein